MQVCCPWWSWQWQCWRSTRDLLDIVDQLSKRGVPLRILSMGGMELDTKQATSKLMLTVLGAIAEFERTLMLERQREGIKKASEEGRYKGRAPTARRKASAIIKLRSEGVKPTDIAKQVGVSRASVYRVLSAGCRDFRLTLRRSAYKGA